MTFTRPLTATAVLLALAAPASALTANATTDLNLRAGPGAQYPVEGVIQTADAVDVQGCIAGSEWCKVMYDGKEGWAHSAYLTASYQAKPVVVYENFQQLEVAPLDYVTDDKNPARTFQPVGDLIIGQPTNMPIVVDDNVTLQYVTANPVQPVYLNGEVVVGAGIPAAVEVYPVPDTTYQYLNVNDQLVVIEPQTRQIIRVVR
ncbi:DUF1236 domain-containing protein [Seohaeicola zhoushanensis]|uniref:SH3b domain-containing protein n=1 Tax=Seohaeicola zhoushanensis TaxID=1569283 RepID=A0A8J3GWS0_9RHOB|nr:DUF1236 domain-containing protein [Seohaeicola zhoushanensis]GHF46657.1 hypothetical protein GCM10017056_17960 [Seohaeicola zhoushanensis]